MTAVMAHTDVAYLVDLDQVETLDVLGPIVQFLTPPQGDDTSPCVMRGTIPPGVSIPMHSHADPETFVALSREVEGLAHSADGFAWTRMGIGTAQILRC